MAGSDFGLMPKIANRNFLDELPESKLIIRPCGPYSLPLPVPLCDQLLFVVAGKGACPSLYVYVGGSPGSNNKFLFVVAGKEEGPSWRPKNKARELVHQRFFRFWTANYAMICVFVLCFGFVTDNKHGFKAVPPQMNL